MNEHGTDDRALKSLNREATTADSLLAELTTAAMPLCRDAGQVLLVEAPEGLALLADRRRVRDAVMHLVRNAVQANPRGRTVRVRAWGQGDVVVFEVSDEGVGMPRDVVKRLAAPVLAVGLHLIASEPGLGEGLAFAKLIAAAHGGHIRAYRRGEAGTMVRLGLPGLPAAPTDVAVHND